MVDHSQGPAVTGARRTAFLIAGFAAIMLSALLWRGWHDHQAALKQARVEAQVQTGQPTNPETKSTPIPDKESAVSNSDTSTSQSHSSNTSVNISNQNNQTGNGSNHSTSTSTVNVNGQSTTVTSTTVNGQTTTNVTHP